MTRRRFWVLVSIALAIASSVPAHGDEPTLADAQRVLTRATWRLPINLALQSSNAADLAAYEVRALRFTSS
jgi:hypothetical protein